MRAQTSPEGKATGRADPDAFWWVGRRGMAVWETTNGLRSTPEEQSPMMLHDKCGPQGHGRVDKRTGNASGRSWLKKKSNLWFILIIHSKIVCQKICLFLQYWGVELRASHLLGRSSTTWATPPALAFMLQRGNVRLLGLSRHKPVLSSSCWLHHG
jgi:hypothetical protein